MDNKILEFKTKDERGTAMNATEEPRLTQGPEMEQDIDAMLLEYQCKWEEMRKNDINKTVGRVNNGKCFDGNAWERGIQKFKGADSGLGLFELADKGGH